jgi:hypothetical protein
MAIKLNLIKTADVLDGVNSFIGVVKFTDIWQYCKIPIYKPGDNVDFDSSVASYQREPKPGRVDKVRDRFLKHRGDKDQCDTVDIQALVDNVNLNIRNPDISSSYIKPIPGSNHKVGGFYEFDYIPATGPIYVVDGQTRMKGLNDAIEFARTNDTHRFNLLKDLTINYTITFTSETSDEAFIFYLLNRYSEPLKKDGIRRILYSGYKVGNNRFIDEIFETKMDKLIDSLEIADNLNENNKSVWFGRISDYNEKSKVINHSTMTNIVVHPLYKYLAKKKVPSQKSIMKITEEYLDAFWGAIADIFPECFGDNRSKYMIQKGNSAGVLTKFMVCVLEKINDNDVFEKIKFSPVRRDDWIERLKIPLTTYKEFNNKTKTDIVGSDNWKVGGPIGDYGNDAARTKLVENLYDAYYAYNINSK